VPADYTIKQGDTAPALADTLTYADGTPVNLTGATISLVARSMTSSAAIELTGTVTITNPATGQILYQPSTQDTALAGDRMANWIVNFGATQMTFPTDGYIWWQVEPNLASEPQALVSLPDVKDYLNSFGTDRLHDNKLLGYIQAATVVIENVVGPVIVRTIDEWHAGGNTHITLRRRPSTALGTTPVLTLIACSEYNGPVEWPLAIVQSPDLGQLYSVMLDQRLAKVVRRTAGGTVQPFPYNGDGQDVHIVYQAGQQTVPANVREATLEAIRINYQQTMPTGTASRTIADDDDRSGPPLGFYLPRHCMELLAPMRRFPSFA